MEHFKTCCVSTSLTQDGLDILSVGDLYDLSIIQRQKPSENALINVMDMHSLSMCKLKETLTLQ